MPQINENLPNVAFFLYGKTKDGQGLSDPVGTGFFIGVPSPARSKRPWEYHVYAVSCWHVAVRDGGSNIRFNTKDEKSLWIELEPDQWEFVPDGADLAAVDVTDRLTEADKTVLIPEYMFATKHVILLDNIGIGEDGFMLGLFAKSPGKTTNLVAARFGNVSLLATDEAPIRQPNGSIRPSHIFDMRSRGGFSGSPVFVYRTPGGDLRKDSNTVTATKNFGLQIHFDKLGENRFLKLLGVHAGQYPEKTKAKKAKTIPHESAAVLNDGDDLEIPSGMTVVIPTWEIIELLNSPKLKKQRIEREQAFAASTEGAAIAESAKAVSIEPEDANPRHKEDFTRLLGAAAKAKP